MSITHNPAVETSRRRPHHCCCWRCVPLPGDRRRHQRQIRHVGSHRASGRRASTACPQPGGRRLLRSRRRDHLHDRRASLVATAGMFANMPVGTPHSFRNESGKPAKMLISVAPAGLEGMFFEVGVPLAQGATTALPPTKEEIEKLLTMAPNYGIEIRVPGH